MPFLFKIFLSLNTYSIFIYPGCTRDLEKIPFPYTCRKVYDVIREENMSVNSEIMPRFTQCLSAV